MSRRRQRASELLRVAALTLFVAAAACSEQPKAAVEPIEVSAAGDLGDDLASTRAIRGRRRRRLG